MDFTFKLQSPKAMNNISAWAGVLTYSPSRPAFPPLHFKDSDNKNGQWLKSLQLRDSYGFFTVFPFNSIAVITAMKPKAPQK